MLSSKPSKNLPEGSDIHKESDSPTPTNEEKAVSQNWLFKQSNQINDSKNPSDLTLSQHKLPTRVQRSSNPEKSRKKSLPENLPTVSTFIQQDFNQDSNSETDVKASASTTQEIKDSVSNDTFIWTGEEYKIKLTDSQCSVIEINLKEMQTTHLLDKLKPDLMQEKDFTVPCPAVLTQDTVPAHGDVTDMLVSTLVVESIPCDIMAPSNQDIFIPCGVSNNKTDKVTLFQYNNRNSLSVDLISSDMCLEPRDVLSAPASVHFNTASKESQEGVLKEKSFENDSMPTFYICLEDFKLEEESEQQLNRNQVEILNFQTETVNVCESPKNVENQLDKKPHLLPVDAERQPKDSEPNERLKDPEQESIHSQSSCEQEINAKTDMDGAENHITETQTLQSLEEVCLKCDTKEKQSTVTDSLQLKTNTNHAGSALHENTANIIEKSQEPAFHMDENAKSETDEQIKALTVDNELNPNALKFKVKEDTYSESNQEDTHSGTMKENETKLKALSTEETKTRTFDENVPDKNSEETAENRVSDHLQETSAIIRTEVEDIEHTSLAESKCPSMDMEQKTNKERGPEKTMRSQVLQMDTSPEPSETTTTLVGIPYQTQTKESSLQSQVKEIAITNLQKEMINPEEIKTKTVMELPENSTDFQTMNEVRMTEKKEQHKDNNKKDLEVEKSNPQMRTTAKEESETVFEKDTSNHKSGREQKEKLKDVQVKVLKNPDVDSNDDDTKAQSKLDSCLKPEFQTVRNETVINISDAQKPAKSRVSDFWSDTVEQWPPSQSLKKKATPSCWLDVELPKKEEHKKRPAVSTSADESLESDGIDDFIKSIKEGSIPFSHPKKKNVRKKSPPPPFAMPAIKENCFEKMFDPEEFQFGLRKDGNIFRDPSPAMVMKQKGVNPEQFSEANATDQAIDQEKLYHEMTKTDGTKGKNIDAGKEEQPIKREELRNLTPRLERMSILSSLLRSPQKSKEDSTSAKNITVSSKQQEDMPLLGKQGIGSHHTGTEAQEVLRDRGQGPFVGDGINTVSDLSFSPLSPTPLPSFAELKLPDHLQKYLEKNNSGSVSSEGSTLSTENKLNPKESTATHQASITGGSNHTSNYSGRSTCKAKVRMLHKNQEIKKMEICLICLSCWFGFCCAKS